MGSESIYRMWTKVAGSIAIGAIAMYVLDPDKGRRRRAIARDKARSVVSDFRDFARVAARDAGNRMEGVRARVRRFATRATVPDDLMLIERVRARMGRVVSHPHAIQIGARDGAVTLSGPILAGEVSRLLDAVYAVPGVHQVDDRLIAYERAASIPSLQGGIERRPVRSEFMQENWTPALRTAAVAGGSLLAACGLRQRGLTSFALTSIGLAMAMRGATNMSMKRMAETAQGRRLIEMQRTIDIAAAPETVYDLWTAPENFPRFMSHVREVRELGDGRTHWVVAGPAGVSLDWDAVVTRAERPRQLSWRTEPGSPVQHFGSVHFEPADGSTRVSLKLCYEARGAVAHALAALLGGDPRRQMNDDLARMKAFIEQGATARDAARPEASRTALH